MHKGKGKGTRNPFGAMPAETSNMPKGKAKPSMPTPVIREKKQKK